ncbi:MAG: 1-acyl-sn-glycerol-3-phosphate acyltransferase [Cyanobacteria bacterium REEB67]|nr:1-acyl-sn-glycerol-3-phosphate acyltransferase [Cyanobacteria bacterium REEB67]
MFNLQTLEYASGCLAAILVIFAGCRIGFWIYQGKRLQETGYMPPPSTKFARWFYKRTCHIFTFLFVGPVKVIGRENARFDGRGLILPNHQFAMDFAVVGEAIPFSYRQVAKAAEVKGVLRGTLAAWIGTVGVQVEGGKAQDGAANTVIATGKNILSHSHGARMLLFPQGMLVFDNELRPKDFRTGATRILQATLGAIAPEEPLYVLPMAIDYKRDRKNATLLVKILHGVGLKAFRRWRDYELIKNEDGSKTKKPRVFTTYGATCVIGKPIDVRTLPADPRLAIEAVRVAIQDLLDQAKAD